MSKSAVTSIYVVTVKQPTTVADSPLYEFSTFPIIFLPCSSRARDWKRKTRSLLRFTIHWRAALSDALRRTRNRRSLCRQKDAILPLQSGSSIDSEKYPQIGMHCISCFIPFCSSVDYLRANIMRAALRNPQTPGGGSQTVFLCWRSVKILAYLCILETRLPYSFIFTYGSKTGNKYPWGMKKKVDYLLMTFCQCLLH